MLTRNILGVGPIALNSELRFGERDGGLAQIQKVGPRVPVVYVK